MSRKIILESTPGDDEVKFIISVYQKLWDNINSKDTRLWTYLGFYGAMLAVLFNVDTEKPMASLSLLLFVVVLTGWACLIVVNSNWWFTRNLLFITRVERYFAQRGLQNEDGSTRAESVTKVIAPVYMQRKFQLEGIYHGSLNALLLVWLLFHFRTLIALFATEEPIGLAGVALLASVHVAVSVSWVALVQRQQRHIASYRELKDSFLDSGLSSDGGQTAAKSEHEREMHESLSLYGLAPGGIYAIFLLLASAVLALAVRRGVVGIEGGWWVIAGATAVTTALFAMAVVRGCEKDVRQGGSEKGKRSEASSARAESSGSVCLAWLHRSGGVPGWPLLAGMVVACIPLGAAAVWGLDRGAMSQGGLGQAEGSVHLRDALEQTSAALKLELLKGSTMALREQMGTIASKGDITRLEEKQEDRLARLRGALEERVKETERVVSRIDRIVEEIRAELRKTQLQDGKRRQ